MGTPKVIDMINKNKLEENGIFLDEWKGIPIEGMLKPAPIERMSSDISPYDACKRTNELIDAVNWLLERVK